MLPLTFAHRRASKRSPIYSKGELIKKPVMLLMGADVQQSHLWFATLAIYSDGSSSLVDYGPVETFAALLEQSNKTYPVRNSTDFNERYGVSKGVVDVAYADRRNETLEFCHHPVTSFSPSKVKHRTEFIKSLRAEIDNLPGAANSHVLY